MHKNGKNKYLIFASTEKNKVMLGNYKELWNEIKKKIELISSDEVVKYNKDVMKIIFESSDILPLNKIINVPVCIIAISSVFHEDNKYYPQFFLHDCFYEYETNVDHLFFE